METTVFEAAGGGQAFLDLARAWHRRCLEDPVVSHAFSHPDQHPDHVQRLAAYWAETLGGPAIYTQTLGDHSHVLWLHSGNGVHEDMDLRAQRCFALALDDARLPPDERLRSTLTSWFRWATTEMAAYPRSNEDVPPGLRLPRWSWDGPVPEPSAMHLMGASPLQVRTVMDNHPGFQPTVDVIGDAGSRPVAICPNCGRPATTWGENAGEGFAMEGQTFCCRGCADEDGCTCS